MGSKLKEELCFSDVYVDTAWGWAGGTLGGVRSSAAGCEPQLHENRATSPDPDPWWSSSRTTAA